MRKADKAVSTREAARRRGLDPEGARTSPGLAGPSTRAPACPTGVVEGAGRAAQPGHVSVPGPVERAWRGPARRRDGRGWCLSMVVILPTTISNRAVLKRAAINVAQTRTQLAKLERDVALDVRKARIDYEHERTTLDRSDRKSSRGAAGDGRRIEGYG